MRDAEKVDSSVHCVNLNSGGLCGVKRRCHHHLPSTDLQPRAKRLAGAGGCSGCRGCRWPTRRCIGPELQLRRPLPPTVHGVSAGGLHCNQAHLRAALAGRQPNSGQASLFVTAGSPLPPVPRLCFFLSQGTRASPRGSLLCFVACRRRSPRWAPTGWRESHLSVGGTSARYHGTSVPGAATHPGTGE